MNFFGSGLQVFFSEPSFSKMFFCSVCIHFLVFGLIIGIPPSRRNMDFDPFYTVDLVNLPPGIISSPSKMDDGKGKISLESAKIVTPAKDAKKRFPMEENYSEQLAATIAKIRDKVARERVHAGEEEVTRTINQIREKIAVKGKGDLANPGFMSSESSSSTLSAMTPGAYRVNLYLATVWEKIRGSWILAEGLVRDGKNLESIVAIKIRRNGQIVDMNFEKKSGNRYLDDSAMRAVKKANPLPPFPDGIREDYLEIGIRFLPSDLG